jgi:CheY-like chemotaxis protein
MDTDQPGSRSQTTDSTSQTAYGKVHMAFDAATSYGRIRMTYTKPTYGPDEETQQMHRKHVLAVNGDPPFLDLIRELLTDERFNVTTTNYVPETFDVIVALEPDMLIVDLVFGEAAGWDLLERLTQAIATRGIPILLTSTNARLLERAARDPARYGTNKDMILPFDIDDLIRAVSDAIGSV